MAHSLRTILTFLPALLPIALEAQGSPAWSQCRMDSLATYNCASYYSGTVTIASERKASGANESWSVTATVTGGKASCRVKTPETPEFTAPGMVTVEHDSNMDAGGYEIRVWCPEAPGQRSSRRDSPIIEVMDKEAANYATLDGKESYEHPDTDPANGVTGTVTQTWHLTKP